MQNHKPSGTSRAPLAGSSPAANLKRRRFLFSLGAGGASAAAAAVAAVPGAALVEVAEVSSKVDGAGYRETQHVRDYYRTAKI